MKSATNSETILSRRITKFSDKTADPLELIDLQSETLVKEDVENIQVQVQENRSMNDSPLSERHESPNLKRGYTALYNDPFAIIPGSIKH